VSRDATDPGARTFAIVGGGAVLVWLLLRGGGWSLGAGVGTADSPAPSTSDGLERAPATPPKPCRVRIDADGIETDGVATDVPAMTTRCRAAGAAELLATGDAVSGVVAEALYALREAGVPLTANADAWTTSDRRPLARRR
jgi:hypothetical protein